MDVLKEKTHQGKGGHGNDSVIRMNWKSKSPWLLSIYHNLNGIGFNDSLAEATLPCQQGVLC